MRRLLAVALGSLLLTTACSAGPPSRALRSPTPVIVDTDMGSDDIVALLYLLASPTVTVRAVTVAGTGLTHCGPGVAHVRQLTALAGRPGIPVACGREDPLDGFRSFPRAWRDLTDSFYGLRLPAIPSTPFSDTAVDLLLSTLRRSPTPVSLLTLGPLTNLA